ncbi:hypothetical protein BC937DRAFT_89509, partial [Endogone sp. FLAS-F59071]
MKNSTESPLDHPKILSNSLLMNKLYINLFLSTGFGILNFAQLFYSNTPTSSLIDYSFTTRSLSFCNIKDEIINLKRLAIANFSTNLTQLKLYMCEHVVNDAVKRFCKLASPLTLISFVGCQCITDESVLAVAKNCPNLKHLDLRGCCLVSNTSIIEIAKCCIRLQNFNIGRLAGCDITDECVIGVVKLHGEELIRISLNNCPKITDKSIKEIANCKHLSVLEIKRCRL